MSALAFLERYFGDRGFRIQTVRALDTPQRDAGSEMMPKDQVVKVVDRAREILLEERDAARLGRAANREWLAEMLLLSCTELLEVREKTLELEEENQQLRSEISKLARVEAH